MFPYSEINSTLRSEVLGANLFDFYRIVDIRSHGVCGFPDGAETPEPTGDTCHHIWSRNSPCANCTSFACIARQEEIVKIEQLDGQALLIFSVPVTIGGQRYALELIKDVTTSLMVPSAVKRDNIEIIQMVSQFNEIAVHDPFTGLYNKTFIDNQIQVMLDEADFEAGKAPAFVIFDIDFFKQVNDHFGHYSGDIVLKKISSDIGAIADHFETGWAGRFGGDEFVLGLPDGLDDAGEALIGQMIESMRSHVFDIDGVKFSVSLSYGISHARPDDTPQSFIERADTRLYKMKGVNHKDKPNF